MDTTGLGGQAGCQQLNVVWPCNIGLSLAPSPLRSLAGIDLSVPFIPGLSLPSFFFFVILIQPTLVKDIVGIARMSVSTTGYYPEIAKKEGEKGGGKLRL